MNFTKIVGGFWHRGSIIYIHWMNRYHWYLKNKSFYINHERTDESLHSIFSKISVLYSLWMLSELLPGLFGKLVVLYILYEQLDESLPKLCDKSVVIYSLYTLDESLPRLFGKVVALYFILFFKYWINHYPCYVFQYMPRICGKIFILYYL